MKPEDHIDALLAEANAGPAPVPPESLVARVLADAATAAPHALPAELPAKPRWYMRVFSPVGGFAGAATLAACATFGVIAGASYADTVLSIPGLETVLAAFSDSTDSTTPLESLSLMMSES